MTLGTAIRDFFATPAGTGVVLLFALATLDFLLGTFAAVRDGTFQLDSLAAWIRKHIAGRVLPVTAVLVIGHLLGGMTLGQPSDVLSPGTILTTVGLAAAGVYVLEIIGSVRESLTPKPEHHEGPDADGFYTLDTGRKIPQD